MLEIDSISRAFGGVYATNKVSLTVQEGELRGIIGPNGAGKSTLLNQINGHLHPQSGKILLQGKRIDGLPPHKRARLGIAMVFQGARMFPGMTALENVMVGAHARTKSEVLGGILRTARHRQEEELIRADGLEALERVGLQTWATREVEDLPLGQQRRLQVARALAAKPKLLLLDEPASGLRATEREDLSRILEELRDSGLTIMLIEHDVAMVNRLADKVTVLDLGQVIADGTPAEIRKNERVIAAYLGAEAGNVAG